MKVFQSLSLFAMLLLGAATMTSCNDDDDSNPPAATGDHTYSFTVVSGDFTNRTFSGTLPNADMAAVSTTQGENQVFTVIAVQEETVGTVWGASIARINGTTLDLNQENDFYSVISLVLDDDGTEYYYMPIDGSVEVSNVVLGPTAFGTSAASFTATFDGTFRNISTNNDSQISGTFTVKQAAE